MFELNDRVFDIRFGWGTIVLVDKLMNYGIRVEFDNRKELLLKIMEESAISPEGEELYTIDGKDVRYGDFALLQKFEYELVKKEDK